MHYRAISNRVAILKFSRVGRDHRESFAFLCLRMIKHGDPVGDQRIGVVLLYLFGVFQPQVMFFFL